MEPSNADRIRDMSDEELAELLEEMTYDSMEHRAAYWLRWLKQPAEPPKEG
jgi:ribosomal protein L29